MDEALRDNLAAAAGPAQAALAPGEAAPGQAADPCAQPKSEADLFSCLMQVAEGLNSSLDLSEVLHQVAERIKRYVDYDTFAVHLLDPLGQELRIRFGLGLSQEVID
ncbi:hypothetical protein MYX77_12265, partial [Acidobacteriia bacterium AH_259_A11_L15]|nr:hypothetical protein [Acidobacteriia bacterium AH_259_A11_L15]